MKNKSKILKCLSSIGVLLEKCGGPGGTPGPCPTGGGAKKRTREEVIEIGFKHIKSIKADLKKEGMNAKIVEVSQFSSTPSLKLPKHIQFEGGVANSLAKQGWKKSNSEVNSGGFAGTVTMTKKNIEISISGGMAAGVGISLSRKTQFAIRDGEID